MRYEKVEMIGGIVKTSLLMAIEIPDMNSFASGTPAAIPRTLMNHCSNVTTESTSGGVIPRTIIDASSLLRSDVVIIDEI